MSEVKHTAPDSFVEQAIRLGDELVAAGAREGFMPGGFAAARSNLRAHLERQAARCAQLEEALKLIRNHSSVSHHQILMIDAALSAPKEQNNG